MAAVVSLKPPAVAASLEIPRAAGRRGSSARPSRVLKNLICVANSRKWEEEKPLGEKRNDLGRRDFILKSTAVSTVLLPFTPKFAPPAFADDALPLELELYEDVKDAFSFLVPKEWKFGEGRAGTRKVVGFYPDGKADTNINLVITMLGADFTSLGSFGTADVFAENLVNSMDRSYLRPPGQEAKLISAKSKNGKYIVEYTLKKPGEEKRYFYSVVGINFNGIYNRLFSLTGQFLESESTLYKEPFQKVIASFKLGAENKS